jgi:hypothetical protein
MIPIKVSALSAIYFILYSLIGAPPAAVGLKRLPIAAIGSIEIPLFGRLDTGVVFSALIILLLEV